MGALLDEQFPYTTGDLLQTRGWTKHSTSTQDITITSGRCRGTGNFVANYYPTVIVPTAADYDVEANIRKVTALGGTGIFVGLDETLANGYLWQWGALMASWVLYRADNNVFTVIGSPASYADNPATGTERVAKLSRRGTRLSAYVDGVLQAQATDSTYAGIGRPAIRIGNSTASTGGHLDWVTVTAAPIPHVRETPPTRLHIDAITPSGRHHRWGDDEPNPADVPRDLRFSTSMPGGFDSLDVTLPRKTKVVYSDLDRLSTLRALGAGGEVAGEYRLERAPRVSGNEVSVSPGAVGWQAHLEDDKGAMEVIIDGDLGNWSDPSTQRRSNLAASSISSNDVSTETGSQDDGAGLPSINFNFQSFLAGVQRCGEQWYRAGGADLGKVRYGFTGPGSAASWVDQAYLSNDDLATALDSGTDHAAASADNQTVTATVAGRRFAIIHSRYGGAFSGEAVSVHAWRPKVLGNHGLTERGTWPDIGFYASDVIAYVVARHAPLLNTSISPSSFAIPQLEFRDPTTVAEMIKAANRFHLNDWAVWDGPGGPTLYYHPRGARGRRWRARVAPAQLTETGPQVDRLWNGVVVKFNDTDGSTKTVGPVGSGSDTETAVLTDTDPANPANQLGIRRWTGAEMGVSAVAAATQLGQVFIEQSKLLDSSGQAQLVGTVRDDRGVRRPAWQVRAGDYISFVDAADTSYRRIVKTDYSHDSRTCSIDLDAPPEGLDALLERLGVVLVPLGL